MPQADLEARHVAKRYAGLIAVDELSFSVDRGSFFSILGPSGCGKTTLLRMIAGFLAPDSGEVLIGGQSMDQVPPNRRPVNMVFQHLALFPMMNVGENVGYGLARRGLSRKDIDQRVGAMLERVSLPLLLDEPLGALDLKLREHMKIELKQLQADFGTTFVYITHDQSEALVLSDHVAVMNKGRFEQVGTPQSLYYEPQTPFVAGFVGANNQVSGRATQVSGDLVDLRLFARRKGDVTIGTKATAFVRPEVATLSRQLEALPANQPRYTATVASLLFDGANSAVLVREQASGAEFHIALPQTGQLADLRVGETVGFGFDPERALCFPDAR